ncbi:small G protein signaling modulator 1-like [Sceloporus undulatus]|uniref:small G protein signaling modulator 1-like n=1 Tax=Sceloporus undulatus TaxID=8520 RepID=UPI001C4A7775|nr:small G protein signaling modulator 1-like [Sceloporus undulatus]
MMDAVDGPILASLLVGPCALEYTKMKTSDHFWTDPSADELVQRHRIHSSHCRQDSPTKRPALCIQKRHSSGSMDDRPSLSARDYVESLHQNSRATLLYGKNNVLVQPVSDWRHGNSNLVCVIMLKICLEKSAPGSCGSRPFIAACASPPSVCRALQSAHKG